MVLLSSFYLEEDGGVSGAERRDSRELHGSSLVIEMQGAPHRITCSYGHDLI